MPQHFIKPLYKSLWDSRDDGEQVITTAVNWPFLHKHVMLKRIELHQYETDNNNIDKI